MFIFIFQESYIIAHDNLSSLYAGKFKRNFFLQPLYFKNNVINVLSIHVIFM
jgi:hypothetical protein